MIAVVSQNTVIPAGKSKIPFIRVDNQPSSAVPVYEGDRAQLYRSAVRRQDQPGAPMIGKGIS